MDFDISRLLEDWDYQPGQVVVRRFKGKDGKEKIQLRVDLGLLQMNAEGRPEGFKLNAEDCAKLQLEALQFHHRYICLLQLEDHSAVIRDAERNLRVFDFVSKHAENEELAWSLQQFRPQLLMVLTRARGSEALQAKDYALAIQHVEEGVEQIRAFYREHSRSEAAESGPEVQSLETWLGEIRARRPLSRREKLERALQDAVRTEDYEKAAKMRDALKNLKPAE